MGTRAVSVRGLEDLDHGGEERSLERRSASKCAAVFRNTPVLSPPVMSARLRCSQIPLYILAVFVRPAHLYDTSSNPRRGQTSAIHGLSNMPMTCTECDRQVAAVERNIRRNQGTGGQLTILPPEDVKPVERLFAQVPGQM